MNFNSHSLFRAIILFVLLYPLAAIAATRHLTVPTIPINPGEVVDVPITLDNAAGLAGLRMQVNFNPELLHLEAVNAGTLGSSFEMNEGIGDGFVQLTFARENALSSGSGNLATMKFRTNAGALPGQNSKLAVADLVLSDASGLIDMRQKDTLILTVGNDTVTIGSKGNNANLSGLFLSSGSLSPAFRSSITNYSAAVGSAVSSIRVTPTVTDSTASIQVNGMTLASGTPSSPIALAVGANTITVFVSARDNTSKKSYKIIVTRAVSSNVNLSGLALSAGSLSPAFSASTTNYSAAVDHAVSSIRVTPTVADGTASIQVNGRILASGTPSSPIALAVGENTITVHVSARNNTSGKSYKIVVRRAESPNANLFGLALSAGSLSPSFSAPTTNYTTAVGHAVSAIRVTPTVADSTASILVNGTTVESGTPSSPISLAVGTNTITVLVSAQNGTTKKSYKIIVTRSVSSNAKLSSLALSAGSLSPAFISSTTNYTSTVGHDVSMIRITPTVADSTASIKVNGTKLSSGVASSPIDLAIGINTITVLVTARDGTTAKTYRVAVTRETSSIANLSGLALSAGSLSPSFSSSNTSYTTAVENNVNSIQFTPKATDPSSSIQVNGFQLASGATSTPIGLAVGPNTISILVTAQNGTTKKRYTVTVIRASSSVAKLSGLTVNNGTLSPAFTSSNTSYTIAVGNAVNSIRITPKAAHTSSSIKVNGTLLPSGATSTPIYLAVGTNTISVFITAQDGTTNRRYTITVTRAASSVAKLSGLAVNNGSLSPDFSPSTTNYSVTVGHAIDSIRITPKTANISSSVKVNGSLLASGATSTPIALAVGTNTITVLVTAQNGVAKKTYTLLITRAQSSNNRLAKLTASNVTLSPSFKSYHAKYQATVSETLTKVSFKPVAKSKVAKIKINGQKVRSGTESASYPLNVGKNTFTITVTAQDGSIRKYSIVITRP